MCARTHARTHFINTHYFFTYTTHFTTAALPLAKAHSSYYNVIPINRQTILYVLDFSNTNCLQITVWD